MIMIIHCHYQGGLDSIKLPEAQQVVLLFQGLAVFREDQIVRSDEFTHARQF